MTAAVEADVAVVGGGPGGYATALRAAGHGLTVVLIEADAVGGTCLHRGCIPSKALLHVGRLADQLGELTELGLATPAGPLDVGAAGAFRDRAVGRMHRGLQGLLKARGVETVIGWGRVAEPGRLTVHDRDQGPQREVVAGDVVLATGSVPVDLADVPVDGRRVLRSDDALRLERVPSSAVVVGAGAVGVEIASLWRSLGAQVTVVEALDRVLPLEDPDSSAALAAALGRRGIDVRTGTRLASVQPSDDDVEVTLADGTSLAVDQVLVAVGRRPATADTGAAELGLLDERGFVKVDDLGRTAAPGVWAVGDVIPTLALAHAAFAEGFAVADAIAGLGPEPVDHTHTPRVTYCTPEVASVGLTEPEARARRGGADVTCTTVPLAGNARSAIEGQGGQVKLVCAGDGTVLGAHVVGPGATEMVGELALATSWGALAAEVGAVAHPHPTLSEAIRETALAGAGTPFHVHEAAPRGRP
jgi:dihydrolipoamide dehydrogenase